MSTLNLDQQAAIYAQQMVQAALEGKAVKEAKAVENLITKTLGVLQEQGVYASMLFLFSRRDCQAWCGAGNAGVYASMLFLFPRGSEEAKIALSIRHSLYELLRQLPAFQSDTELASLTKESKASDVLPFYAKKVCGNLDTLLLVKDLYEQTLIYARYGAKAEGKA